MTEDTKEMAQQALSLLHDLREDFRDALCAYRIASREAQTQGQIAFGDEYLSNLIKTCEQSILNVENALKALDAPKLEASESMTLKAIIKDEWQAVVEVSAQMAEDRLHRRRMQTLRDSLPASLAEGAVFGNRP
jgi:hypothetical protein